jgi:hypothetical protein
VLRTPRPVVSVSYFSGAAWARFDDGENLRSTHGGRRWAPAVFSIGGTGVRRPIETTDAGRTWHVVHRWG